MATTAAPDRLPDLSSDHAPRGEEIAAFLRDGRVRVRDLASREEVDAYRPALRSVLDAVATRHDTQGRIDAYQSLFTQVTNAWRLDDSVRRFVFARRFTGVAARLMDVTACATTTRPFLNRWQVFHG